MRKVLYAKFNSYRKKEFRIATKIVEENGKRYVEKKALCYEAVQHINAIKSNYSIIKDLYKQVIVCPYIEVKNSDGTIDNTVIKFPFISGHSLISAEDNRNIDDLKNSFFHYYDIIFDYNEEYISKFDFSDNFIKLFPGCEPKKNIDSVIVANVDGIFQNYIESDNIIYLIDYEWIFKFLIPIDYIQYRCLKEIVRVWSKYRNDTFLSQIINNDFYDNKLRCEMMEKHFQEYVNGKNEYGWRYLSDTNSLKKIIDEKNWIYEEHQKTCDILHRVEKERNEFEEKLMRANKRIDDIEKNLVDTVRLKDEYETLYNDLINSNSWKITKPFRKIRGLFKK